MRVSVVQMQPGSDKAANIAQADRLIDACVRKDRPDLVVLPEVWTCLGGDRAAKCLAAETVPVGTQPAAEGSAVRFLSETARRHRLHLHGGSIAEHAGERLLNTSLVFAPDGRLLARYSKIHLFDITTPDGTGYRESDTYQAGDTVNNVTLEGEFGRVNLGLAICYDLRFPELFLQLRRKGADLIALPAAFTAETGQAHWHTLVRARAIETQCWLAAAGTDGTHRDADGHARSTYGHSVIVDPWGMITAERSGGEGWATSRIDLDLTRRVRAGIPVMEHRRLA